MGEQWWGDNGEAGVESTDGLICGQMVLGGYNYDFRPRMRKMMGST